MSFGIPCIATNVGGTPEIVNNKNGHLLMSDPSAKEVAKAITDFYNLPHDGKEKKRIAAYKTWKNKYNAEVNYSKFAEELL